MTSGSTASVRETMEAINSALSGSDYRCQTVSWDDVQRGTIGGALSCWGGNITDTRLWEKSGELLYTVRSQNWNEKLGSVPASEVALMAGGVQEGMPPQPVTLSDFLKGIGRHGAYAGMEKGTDLSHGSDAAVSIRFQTTFLPVPDERLGALEFAPEMYNYQTRADDDPKNLLLLCTTQGTAIQQDGKGAKKLFHHAVDPSGRPGDVCRYWFEAERTAHKVGGAQAESAEEKADALKRGKAVSAVIGTRAMGTRFNVLMTIQVPLEQKPRPKPPSGGGGGWGGGGVKMKMMKKSALKSCGGSVDGVSLGMSCESMAIPMAMKSVSLSMSCESMAVPMAMNSMDSSDADLDMIMGSLKCSGLDGDSPVLARASTAAPMRTKPPPKKGTANAARVSRGSLHDTWQGLGVKAPKRDGSQHVTVTVVIYNTVAGGVPGVEDVKAAIDDMEKLYRACGWKGRLADDGANFMKAELTVNDALTIANKAATQPYQPESMAPIGGAAFPSSAPPGSGEVVPGQPATAAGHAGPKKPKCAVM